MEAGRRSHRVGRGMSLRFLCLRAVLIPVLVRLRAKGRRTIPQGIRLRAKGRKTVPQGKRRRACLRATFLIRLCRQTQVGLLTMWSSFLRLPPGLRGL